MATDFEVGVLGAGAIGCYLGGRIAAAGQRVVLVGRARGIAELEQAGLALTALSGETRAAPREQVSFATEPAALASASIVLCCVKSAQTAGAGGELRDVLRPDALVVSMQNGLRNAARLRERLPGARVLGAVVGFNVVSKTPGSFRQATAGSVIFEGAHPLAARLAAALRAGGADVELVRDVEPHQAAKLVMNLNNAVSALSGAPSRDLVLVSGYRRIVAAIVAEAVGVFRAAGVRAARLRGIPLAALPFVLGLPTPLLALVARAQFQIDPEARSSMWEDLERRRPTEVDELNGEIVRLAEGAGTTAPLNRRIVDLVHEVEAEKRGSPGMSPDDLWRALAPRG